MEFVVYNKSILQYMLCFYDYVGAGTLLTGVQIDICIQVM